MAYLVSVRAYMHGVYVSCHQLESIRFEEKKICARFIISVVHDGVRAWTYTKHVFSVQEIHSNHEDMEHISKKKQRKPFICSTRCLSLCLFIFIWKSSISINFFLSFASFLFSHLNLRRLLRSSYLDDKSTRAKRKECYQLFQNRAHTLHQFRFTKRRTSYSLLNMRT